MAVPCGSARSVFSPSHRLVNEAQDVQRPAIDALLMAGWRRKSQQQVIIHSDQGSQFGSSDWQKLPEGQKCDQEYEPAGKLS